MKRIYSTAFVGLLGFMYWAYNPQNVSTVTMLTFALVACLALIASLVFMPVTEYFKVPYEVAVPNSFKYGINHFRDKSVICILASGAEIEGVFRARNDAAGTFSVELFDGSYEIFPQAKLERIRTTGLENVPHSMLEWDDTSSLLIPRGC